MFQCTPKLGNIISDSSFLSVCVGVWAINWLAFSLTLPVGMLQCAYSNIIDDTLAGHVKPPKQMI